MSNRKVTSPVKIADRVAQLSADKRALLQRKLEDLTPQQLDAIQRRLLLQKRPGYEPIPVQRYESEYPLSFHQMRVWIVEQFHSGHALYNVTWAFRIRGRLNVVALTAALQSLVHRHEALRTTFHVVDGNPIQRINPAPDLRLSTIDMKDSDGAMSGLGQQMKTEGRGTFDLSVDLMLRGVLYEMAPDDNVLQLTTHHLVSDGWSRQVLFEEMARLYDGLCADDLVELDPLHLRYVDVARWQRSAEREERFAEGLQWWKRELLGVPTMLEFATAQSRSGSERSEAVIQPLMLSTDLMARLGSLAREEGATLYMILVATYFILLHRYTGMADFLVGSVTSGRDRPETRGVVGFFADTVVLHAKMSHESTARDVLRHARGVIIEAVDHSDVPFDQVVRSMGVPRDLDHHPLVQAFFNAPPPCSLALGDLDVSRLRIDLEVSRFDLEFNFSSGDTPAIDVAWNRDLFDAETIELMLGHYEVLLHAIVDDPDRQIGALPMLTDRERQQLLVDWNDTGL